MPFRLPRSWAEARCHQAIRSIFSDDLGHWVELEESYCYEDAEGAGPILVGSFRDLRSMLSTVSREGSNEGRVSRVSW
jgi:hypothetical protein